MAYFPEPVARLIEALQKLPGVGPKSAQRMTFFLLKRPADEVGELSAALTALKTRIVHYCIENGIPYDSSVTLDRFKGADGNLDDVKLIKAFSDDKTPLVFTPKAPIPADAVTASASGLDPHISPANAEIQMARVAQTRGVTLDAVRAMVGQHTEGAWLGFIGEPRVNVLQLNIALDQRLPRK
jgi:hypothetical protein